MKSKRSFKSPWYSNWIALIQNLHTKPSESPKYIIKNQQSFYHLTSKDMKLNFSTEQELIFIIGCLRWEKLWNHITIILLLLFKENITSIKVKSRFVTKDTISYDREDNPSYNLMQFFSITCVFVLIFWNKDLAVLLITHDCTEKTLSSRYRPANCRSAMGQKWYFFNLPLSLWNGRFVGGPSSPYLSLSYSSTISLKTFSFGKRSNNKGKRRH